MKQKQKLETYDLGNRVFCDMCGDDYTISKKKGGILFGSKAVCPECAPRIEASAVRFHEESYIKARCPEDKTFKDWVIEDLREGKSAVVTVTNFDI